TQGNQQKHHFESPSSLQSTLRNVRDFAIYSAPPYLISHWPTQLSLGQIYCSRILFATATHLEFMVKCMRTWLLIFFAFTILVLSAWRSRHPPLKTRRNPKTPKSGSRSRKL